MASKDKPQSNTASTASHRVARSAALVACFLALDKILGIVREMVVSRAFGASMVLDAYTAAFEIPEGLNTIVTGAALTTSLIPMLTTLIARDDPEDLWRFVSTVVNWVLLVVSGASIAAAILARPLTLLFAAGFADNAAQVTLIIQLMRLVLIQTLIFSASTLVTGTLQAHQHFLLPALSPTFYTLGRIFGALVLAPKMGIFGLAWGGLIGAVFHLLVKLPWLLRHQARWTPTLTHPEFLPLLRLMAPRMLGMGVTYINFVLPTTFGSYLEEGAISVYEYGWKLMQLPETVLGTAMGIAVLPTLTTLAVQGSREELRRTFSWALRLVLTLAIPAGAGLFLLGRPLVILLLQGGEFDSVATERVYETLRFFSLGLIMHASLEIVARLFYAQKDMWPPFWAAVAGLVTNAGFGWLFLPTLTHSAVPFSNTLGVGLQVGILLIIARTRLRGIEDRAMIKSIIRAIGGTAIMASAMWGVLRIMPNVAIWLQALLGLGVGAVTYLLAALLLRSEEILSLPRLLSKRKTT